MNTHRFALTLAAASLALLTPAWAQLTKAKSLDSLELIDRTLAPTYDMGLNIITSGQVENGGDTALAEFGGNWQFAYFANVLRADIDLNFDGALIVFTDSAGVGFPDQLARAVLDAGATWRYVNDVALETRVKPGYYGDLEDFSLDPFYMPFSVSVLKGFSPDVSGVFGIEMRPGFDREVMPTLAVGWRLDERVHLKAGLPESRLTYYASELLTPYLGLDWNSATYALHDAGGVHGREMTLEDFRLYGGVRYRLSEELQIAGELGESFSRKFKIDPPQQGVDRELSVDGAAFVRVVLIGPF